MNEIRIFDDMVETLMFSIRNDLMGDKYGYGSITNGFLGDKKQISFSGYRPKKKDFPRMIAITFENEWEFNKLYNQVIFDKTSTITVRIYHERFDLDKLKDFKPELKEFENIKPRSFKIEFKQTSPHLRKFTKKDIKEATKKLDELLPEFLEDVEVAIKKQAERRFDELLQTDEEVAMRYLPEHIKDVFIF